jgi:hypothetical protein
MPTLPHTVAGPSADPQHPPRKAAMYVQNCISAELINASPGNSSVNKVQHATVEESVFSSDTTDAPIDWLDSDHVSLRSLAYALKT